MTLVALFAMTAGAWADEVTIGDGTGTTYYFPIDNFFNYSCTEEIYTADEIGTAGTITSISFYYNYGTAYTCSNVKMFMKHVTRSVFESNADCEPLSETDLVWEGSIAPTEAGWFTFTLDTPFEYNGTDNLLVAFYDGTSGYPGTSYTWRQTTSPNSAHMALRYYSDSANPDPYNLSNYSGSKTLYPYRANIKLDIAPAGPKVTINDAKTEASFEMPTNDVTISYELVRDMAISMPVTVGDGNDGYRIRIKKNDQTGKFEPAETEVAGMMALIKVHDAIENEDLTFFNLGGAVDCAVSIYAIDDNDQPVGDPVAFQDLVPGRYIAKATAATGSTYDGETTLSNIFVLFQGFELEIAAGEYATFYKEEPLYVEDEDAKLYTISSVTDDAAVLSEQIAVAPALTPLLVYNSSDETKTFLLIPSVEEADDVTPAEEFKGTLVAKTFSEDDMAAANHFVLTAAQAFVWVKNAGTIAANRCWLELPISAASNARVIVFGDATGIDGISDISGKSGDWFDLNGRKLQKMPTKKGIYILNGRKVVVK